MSQIKLSDNVYNITNIYNENLHVVIETESGTIFWAFNDDNTYKEIYAHFKDMLHQSPSEFMATFGDKTPEMAWRLGIAHEQVRRTNDYSGITELDSPLYFFSSDLDDYEFEGYREEETDEWGEAPFPFEITETSEIYARN